MTMLSNEDMAFLGDAVDLAEQAVEQGDQPFGSVLVLDGQPRFSDHNRVSGGDHTRHPEFAIARWAANNLTVEERAAAVVYTSGEHCPMCAAAHGWSGSAASCTPPPPGSWGSGFGNWVSHRPRSRR